MALIFERASSFRTLSMIAMTWCFASAVSLPVYGMEFSLLSRGSLSSLLHVAMQLRLSLHLCGAGGSWADYCWNSLPSRYTFRRTIVLDGLARCCPSWEFHRIHPVCKRRFHSVGALLQTRFVHRQLMLDRGEPAFRHRRVFVESPALHADVRVDVPVELVAPVQALMRAVLGVAHLPELRERLHLLAKGIVQLV